MISTQVCLGLVTIKGHANGCVVFILLFSVIKGELQVTYVPYTVYTVPAVDL